MSGAPMYYANIITYRFHPDAAECVIGMYRERTGPLVAAAPGQVAAFGLIHRASGRGIGVRVWQSLADRQRSDALPVEILDDLVRYAAVMTGAFTRDPYDVAVYTLPPVDPERSTAPAVARVTIEHLQPDRWDDGVAALRAFALDRRTDRADAPGIVLFENRGVSRAMLIEMARSQRELDVDAGRMQDHDLAARRSGYLLKRTEREVYEVMARY